MGAWTSDLQGQTEYSRPEKYIPEPGGQITELVFVKQGIPLDPLSHCQFTYLVELRRDGAGGNDNQ